MAWAAGECSLEAEASATVVAHAINLIISALTQKAR